MGYNLSCWWSFLWAASALNILAWIFSARALRLRRSFLSADAYALRRLQLLLSAAYVLGCAFRSLLPVFDVPRLCLVDSWLSSVIVGRSVATIAELCFVAQWALLLRETAVATGSRPGRLAAAAMLPLIAVAEICSWYAVLTTANLGHVIEETLWGLGATLLVIGLGSIWPRCAPAQRPLVAAWAVVGVAYVFFMFLVDVPTYWFRWLADEASGRSYLSLAQGALDASSRWVVSYRWEDWKGEVIWMSLYFSVAVWLSIALIHAPVPQGAPGPRRRMASS